jgi:hypothetical protein
MGTVEWKYQYIDLMSKAVAQKLLRKMAAVAVDDE